MGFEVAGKRVLVTGSTSGIGAAMSRALAERGAIVGVCGRRADRLAAVLADVRAESGVGFGWQVDLSELDGIESFAERVVNDMGGLDIVINNAGIPKRRWAWAHRPDEIADVLRLNVESPMRLTLALLDELERSSGRVVFVGSVAARLTPPAEAVYAASKAAITAFAECLSVDLRVAGRLIGVHVVHPGVLDTELFDLPDNDPPISDIEPLAVDEIVGPLLEALDTGRFETFVPGWFAEIGAIKVGDLDGFLQGSVEYTVARLEELAGVAGVGGATRPRPQDRST